MWPEEKRRLQQLYLSFIILFALVALVLTSWSVLQSLELGARVDNPRRVDAELVIQRGQIIDREGIVLAETVMVKGIASRIYPLAAVGPAVGYYSFQHGTSGAETALDAQLRGEATLWDIWLHRPQSGNEVRLKLDVDWQLYASQLMAGKEGAMLLTAVPTGDILAMVSYPGYDPNLLDEQFDVLSEAATAPLLNRVTQGNYQPGLILQPFVVAWGVDQGLIQLTDLLPDATQPLVLQYDGEIAIRLACLSAPAGELLTDGLAVSCPQTTLPILTQLTPEMLQTIWRQFGFLHPVELRQESQPLEMIDIQQVEAALWGQESLTISPAQLMIGWLNLVAQENRGIGLRLADGMGTIAALPEVPAVDGRDGVRQALVTADGRYIEYMSVVQAGTVQQNSWYMGAAPADNPTYAVIILVENSEDWEAARETGRAMLENVINGISR